MSETMEKKYFDWKSWDGSMSEIMSFYDCTLKRDVGKFKKGDKIPNIDMSFEEGWMQFYDHEKEDDPLLAEFKFEITVIE